MNIGIIGSGNVALHLCRALTEKGHHIQLFRRSDRNQEFYETLKNVQTVAEIVDLNAEVILIVVNDNQIGHVASQLVHHEAVIAHTSGSIDLKTLIDTGCANCGVFYPLQSFTANRKLEYNSIPVLLEHNSELAKTRLKEVADSFTDLVHEINSEERKKIHLAAVIVNNFVNHLLSEVQDFIDDDDKLGLLFPLMEETMQRAREGRASEFMTGPAVRGDENVVNQHLKMLSENPELEELYAFITKSIQKSDKY